MKWSNNSTLVSILACVVVGILTANFIGKSNQIVEVEAKQIEAVAKAKEIAAVKKVVKTPPVSEKKERFKTLLVPAIDQVYLELRQQHRDIAEALQLGESAELIAQLKKEYRAANDAELLLALNPHPRSIALAQAALESAWGTSRFFVEANNVFGIWSRNPNEPRIAAGQQRGDKTIWLKKYESVYASVKDNYKLLARGTAFREFRDLRGISDNPYDMVKKLDAYSEKGADYGKALASVIRYNKFTQYDDTYYDSASAE